MGEQEKAQETKVAETKTPVGKAILKYLIGIVLVVLGALLLWTWRASFICVVKGCIGPFLILAGAITIAIAKE
ncbi:MAG: hypothetical protein JSW40_01760 [Candidatus Omnitrophota bacterium]|nr:MAG: hypothetical protein JSW40_01760 [Candidatus Omnitrophota bacterium]